LPQLPDTTTNNVAPTTLPDLATPKQMTEVESFPRLPPANNSLVEQGSQPQTNTEPIHLPNQSNPEKSSAQGSEYQEEESL
jgi:hypothetical protein